MFCIRKGQKCIQILWGHHNKNLFCSFCLSVRWKFHCIAKVIFSLCLKNLAIVNWSTLLWERIRSKKLRRFPLNVRAVNAKIKLPKKYLHTVTFWKKIRRTYRYFCSKADPARKKLDLKLSVFQLKRRFMSVQNILLRDLKLIFSRMLENFIVGSLGQVNLSEMFQIAFKMLPCYK